MLNKYHHKSKKCDLVKKTNHYLTQRVEMALVIKNILEHNNNTWFIESGTLLGAYRNGKMINHDYDIDFAIYGNTKTISDLANLLKTKLPPIYSFIHYTDTMNKIMVFNDKSGLTYLNDAKTIPLYNITLDIQLYIDYPMDNNNLQGVYYKYDYHKIKFNKKYIFPLKQILFEGNSFNCPTNIEKFLEPYYGYLGEDFYYNTITNKYEKST